MNIMYVGQHSDGPSWWYVFDTNGKIIQGPFSSRIGAEEWLARFTTD